MQFVAKQVYNKSTVGQLTSPAAVKVEAGVKHWTPEPEAQYNPHKISTEPTGIATVDIEWQEPILDTDKFRCMYDPPVMKRAALNDRVQSLGAQIAKTHDITEFCKLSEVVQDDREYLAVVQSCTMAGKVANVVVDGLWTPDTPMGRNIALSLEGVPSFTLFPGKVIGLKGKNLGGTRPDAGVNGTIMVSEVYDAPVLPPWSLMPKNEMDVDEIPGGEPCRMHILSGPYAPNQGQVASVLRTLLKDLVTQRQASVVVVAGPFIYEAGNNAQNVLLEDLFEGVVDEIERCMQTLTGLKVILVPSLKELTAEFVYPQPAFDMAFDSKGLMALSNPATFSVKNDFTVGISTNDILKHMAAKVIEHQPVSKLGRIQRIAAEVLKSHSFYPLTPADEEAQVDFTHHKYYEFTKCSPDVLVLPSMLGSPFCQNIEGVLVINPGRVQQGQFVELTVKPGKGPVTDRAVCEVFKLK